MNTARVYTLTGLPYAGKTTLRNELVKRLGFKVVSADDVIDEMGMDVDTMTQEDWNTAYSVAFACLKEYLQQGNMVIVDIGNLKKSERDTISVLAKSLGIPNTLIYVNTPIDEITRRREDNKGLLKRGHLSDKVMNLALSMWEEPTFGENPVLFNSEMSLDEWIRANIKVQNEEVDKNADKQSQNS